jgi:hypothetical protein
MVQIDSVAFIRIHHQVAIFRSQVLCKGYLRCWTFDDITGLCGPPWQVMTSASAAGLTVGADC